MFEAFGMSTYSRLESGLTIRWSIPVEMMSVVVEMMMMMMMMTVRVMCHVIRV
jgi:hypothetical protein